MTTNQQQFYYKNNRLQQLRGFCYTVQFGSITRAAEYMGLNHSSVSFQIKALEEELGIPLLIRKGPRIELTRTGKEFFKTALPYVDGIQNLYENFHQDMQHAQKTEFHIAANSTSLNFILPKITKEYLANNPDVYLHIHFAEHDEAIEKLKLKEIDFALLPRRAHKPFPKSYEYIPLFHYTPALITRPDHPLAGRKRLSVEEISQYELTLPAEELRVIPNLYDIFPEHKINKKLRIHFVNFETGRRFIESGEVITISSTVFMEKNDSLIATPLTHLFPNVDYGIVLRNGIIPEKIAAFIEIARKRAEKDKHARK